MTAGEAIRRFDDLRPNKLPLAVKLARIGELELRLARECFPDFTPSGEVGEEHELCAAGFENMYYLWLCAQLDFENADTVRYNNDVTVFNREYAGCAAWAVRSRASGGHIKAGAVI